MFNPEEYARGGAKDLSGTGVPLRDLVVTTTEYTADTTWVKPENFIGVYCEAIGGGGGGGGVDVAAGESATGGGGGGGAYEAGWVSSRTLEQVRSVAITIGALGAGGANTGGNGSAGGDTSFGSYVVAAGGQQGIGTTVDGGDGTVGVGGAASGSSNNLSGHAGQGGVTAAGAAWVWQPAGGNSHWGYGGRGRLLAAGSAIPGAPGAGFGAGGGGAAVCQSDTGVAGGAGTAGKLILHVFTYQKT